MSTQWRQDTEDGARMLERVGEYPGYVSISPFVVEIAAYDICDYYEHVGYTSAKDPFGQYSSGRLLNQSRTTDDLSSLLDRDFLGSRWGYALTNLRDSWFQEGKPDSTDSHAAIKCLEYRPYTVGPKPEDLGKFREHLRNRGGRALWAEIWIRCDHEYARLMLSTSRVRGVEEQGETFPVFTDIKSVASCDFQIKMDPENPIGNKGGVSIRYSPKRMELWGIDPYELVSDTTFLEESKIDKLIRLRKHSNTHTFTNPRTERGWSAQVPVSYILERTNDTIIEPIAKIDNPTRYFFRTKDNEHGNTPWI